MAGADGGAAARPVIDHYRLAKDRPQWLCQQPADDIDRATGAEGDHQADWPGRPGFGVAERRQDGRGGAAQ